VGRLRRGSFERGHFHASRRIPDDSALTTSEKRKGAERREQGRGMGGQVGKECSVDRFDEITWLLPQHAPLSRPDVS